MSDNNETDENTPKPEDNADDLENKDLGEDGGDNEDLGNEGGEVEDDDDVDESKATYTKADVDKAAKRRQAALARARKAEQELADLKKQHATKEERLKLEAAEEAANKAEQVFKPAILRKHLFYEMATLGLTKEQIPDIVDLIKMDKIEVDDEFNIEGVDEEIERIKGRFPKLFETEEVEEKKPTPKKKVPKGEGAPKPTPQKPLTAKEQIVKRLRGEV